MNLKSNSYILAASFAGIAFFGMAFVVMGAVLPSVIVVIAMVAVIAMIAIEAILAPVRC